MLRIVGGVLMIAAEGCAVMVIFGTHSVAWTIAAATVMVVGVVVWQRGWRLGR